MKLKRVMREPKETFKDVQGYKGLYQISNLGNIKSLSRGMHNPRGGVSVLKERLLKQGTNKKGYKTVNLCKNSKHTSKLVHRLVVESFLGEIPKYKQIDHIDCDKANNKLHNLEIVSLQENIKRAKENGLMVGAKGERNTFAKLSNEDVINIRDLYSKGLSTVKIHREHYTNTSYTNVKDIVARRTWKHI